MTLDEAIKWLNIEASYIEEDVGNGKEILDAYDMAIKALEQEPCFGWRFYYDHGYAQAKRDLLSEVSEDCISREALLAKIDEERKYLLTLKMDGAEHIVVHHARRIIEDIPPVTPQPKIGRWEVTYNNGDIYHLRCSACKEEDCRMYPTDKYCPNCGAKMEVET